MGIVIKNGSLFISSSFQDLRKIWGIKQNFFTPCYPQAKGQAESSNKTIIQTMKRRLQKATKAWADELLGVLWSYRTTTRSSTSETPFSLAYDSNVVILVEVSVPLARSNGLMRTPTGNNFAITLTPPMN